MICRLVVNGSHVCSTVRAPLLFCLFILLFQVLVSKTAKSAYTLLPHFYNNWSFFLPYKIDDNPIKSKNDFEIVTEIALVKMNFQNLFLLLNTLKLYFKYVLCFSSTALRLVCY